MIKDVSRYNPKIFIEEYDDYVGCITQSIQDGYADYCYNEYQLSMVTTRIRALGKVAKSFLCKKITDENIDYYHILPVYLYKRKNGKDISIPGIPLKLNKIFPYYKIEYIKDDKKIIIKDYNHELNSKALDEALEYSNLINE